jgi:hypothetical protein
MRGVDDPRPRTSDGTSSLKLESEHVFIVCVQSSASSCRASLSDFSIVGRQPLARPFAARHRPSIRRVLPFATPFAFASITTTFAFANIATTFAFANIATTFVFASIATTFAFASIATTFAFANEARQYGAL